MTTFNSFPIQGTPISGLSNEISPALTDIVPSVQSGVTYNLSLQQILSLISANIAIEGVWTPTDNSGAGLAFTFDAGTYIRIGNLVVAGCAVTYPVTANGANASIGGLPFATGASPSKQAGSVIYTTVSTLVYAATGSGGTSLGLYAAAGTAITNATMSTTTVYLQAIYQL